MFYVSNRIEIEFILKCRWRRGTSGNFLIIRPDRNALRENRIWNGPSFEEMLLAMNERLYIHIPLFHFLRINFSMDGWMDKMQGWNLVCNKWKFHHIIPFLGMYGCSVWWTWCSRLSVSLHDVSNEMCWDSDETGESAQKMMRLFQTTVCPVLYCSFTQNILYRFYSFDRYSYAD